MAANLVPFKGLPTFEMIAKLQDNIHTLNSEIETLVATTHPVAIYLLTQKKCELSSLLAKEEAKVKQMRRSYGLDTAYGYLLDTYKESSAAPVSPAAGTVSTVSAAAGTSSDAAAAGGGTSSDAAATATAGTSSDAAATATATAGTSSDAAAEEVVAAAAAAAAAEEVVAAAEGSIVAAAADAAAADAAEGSIVAAAADAAEAGGSILAGSARSTRVRWGDLYTTVYNEVVSKMREEDCRPRNIHDAMIATGLVPSVEYVQVVWHHQSIAKKAKKADGAKV
ncbi:unnamed protein product [Arabidopsis halleri]